MCEHSKQMFERHKDYRDATHQDKDGWEFVLSTHLIVSSAVYEKVLAGPI